MIKLTKDLIVRSSTEEFITFKLQEKDKGIQGELFPDLCEEEQRIIDCLRQSECLQINALAVATNLPVHKLSAFLFNLEMKGIVRLLNGGMYRLT